MKHGKDCDGSRKSGTGRPTGKLYRLLRDRSGGSLVEVLAACFVFLIVMGLLHTGLLFASGARRKAQSLRDNALQFRRSAHENMAVQKTTACGTGTISFGGGSFSVPVEFRSVQAAADSSDPSGGDSENNVKTVTFYYFAARDLTDGQDSR